MAVSLGRSTGTPAVVLAQITHALSLYFLLLVVVRVTIKFAVTCHARQSQGPTGGSCFQRCFHVSMVSLFDGPVTVKEVTASGAPSYIDSSAWQFMWMHVITSMLLTYPLAVLIQRRKLTLDFVGTIFAAYFLLANITLGRFYGGGLLWWATVAFGLGVLYTLTWLLARRRELQDVKLGGGTITTSGTNGAGGSLTPAHRQQQPQTVAVEMECLVADAATSVDTGDLLLQPMKMATPGSVLKKGR